MAKDWLVSETCQNCGYTVTYDRHYDYSLPFEASLNGIPTTTLED